MKILYFRAIQGHSGLDRMQLLFQPLPAICIDKVACMKNT